jgi:hypothetical protein
MNRTDCAECGGTMEAGYIADNLDHTTVLVPFWVQGEPEMSRFLGLSAGLKVKDRPRYHVVTYRCRLCGLLKSYAPADRAI